MKDILDMIISQLTLKSRIYFCYRKLKKMKSMLFLSIILCLIAVHVHTSNADPLDSISLINIGGDDRGYDGILTPRGGFNLFLL